MEAHELACQVSHDALVIPPGEHYVGNGGVLNISCEAGYPHPKLFCGGLRNKVKSKSHI